MASPTHETAGEILRRVAAEVGVEPISDPFASSEPAWVQLRYLLDSAGDSLALEFPWEVMQKEHQIITQQGDSGVYDLPPDFSYMIPQTGWERAENVPLFGPLSPQDWAYLEGRDLVSYTIYASFRLQEGKFTIFPYPPPVGLDINFEYMAKNWVEDADNPTLLKDSVAKNNDRPLYHRHLITRYTKVKYYEAKGMDTKAAQEDFNQVFSFLTGKDMSAEVLSAGRNRRGFPYLDTYNNTPDTNYGNP